MGPMDCWSARIAAAFEFEEDFAAPTAGDMVEEEIAFDRDSDRFEFIAEENGLDGLPESAADFLEFAEDGIMADDGPVEDGVGETFAEVMQEPHVPPRCCPDPLGK